MGEVNISRERCCLYYRNTGLLDGSSLYITILKLLIEMVRSKKASLYRKKRKGFVGIQKQAMDVGETSRDETANSNMASPCMTSESSEDCSPVGASRRKLSSHGYHDNIRSSDKSETSGIPQQICQDAKGYRFVDIGNLSSAFSKVHGREEGKYF